QSQQSPRDATRTARVGRATVTRCLCFFFGFFGVVCVAVVVCVDTGGAPCLSLPDEPASCQAATAATITATTPTAITGRKRPEPPRRGPDPPNRLAPTAGPPAAASRC